ASEGGRVGRLVTVPDVFFDGVGHALKVAPGFVQAEHGRALLLVDQLAVDFGPVFGHAGAVLDFGRRAPGRLDTLIKLAPRGFRQAGADRSEVLFTHIALDDVRVLHSRVELGEHFDNARLALQWTLHAVGVSKGQVGIAYSCHSLSLQNPADANAFSP